MRASFLRLLMALCLVTSAPVSAASPAQPRLLVLISVDQFAASVYKRYQSEFTAGLKRLSSGIVYPIAYQSHGATETCPGHSTMLSGDHPSHTGIVANNWFDRAAGTSVYCVTVAGTGDPLARGPQKLKTTTFGDWLKQARKGSRVVSISGKDRAAIMMAGHHPDLVAWWTDGFVNDRPMLGFQTSRFAGPAGPSIQALLKQQNEKIRTNWRERVPQLWPSDISSTCMAMQKPHHFGDIDVSGAVPPAVAIEAAARPGFAERTEFQEALRASPMLDSLTLDFAASVAKRWGLGRDANPDLLAVSLSATDYVGHHYGNGGAEMCEQIHALDQSLGAFLARIDQLGVPYMVVLTADHGSVDAPERLKQQGIAGLRVDSGKFLGDLNKHLKQLLRIDWDPITADDPQQLYLNSPGDVAFIGRLRSETMAWLRQQASVETVFDKDMVAAATPPQGKSPADLTLAERLNESFDPARSADIFVVFKKYTTLGWPRGPSDAVAGHGSPWDYDRQVPLLFWWPGAPSTKPQSPAETVDIAPTLARIIHLAPQKVDGRCLTSVTNCSNPR